MNEVMKRSCPINYVSHSFTRKIQRNRLEVLKEMRILHGAKNIFDSKHARPWEIHIKHVDVDFSL